MSDLISRQAALDALKEYEIVESDNFTKTDPITMMAVATIANCIEAIVELPPAEPEERTAKVIPIEKEILGGTETVTLPHCALCKTDVTIWDKYCPHCGVKLDWENDIERWTRREPTAKVNFPDLLD